MALSVLAATVLLIAESTAKCVPAEPQSFTWTSEDNMVKLNGEQFNLKGYIYIHVLFQTYTYHKHVRQTPYFTLLNPCI